MISADNLSLSFGQRALFNDVSFVINKRESMALVGKNGAGKTTLLRILAGLQTVDSGSLSIPKKLTVGYLPQQMNLNDCRTVMEETMTVFSAVRSLEERYEQCLTRLEKESGSDTQELLEQLARLQEQIQLQGGKDYIADTEKTLLGLGFLRTDFERPTSQFSGGWRMRIELAKILLQRPDLLLLDEPTNHLDIESIQWLENFLKNYSGALVLVSHDRAFLDNVTLRTIEIVLGNIYDYRVPYSRFVELRTERREQQLRAYENQQKQIKDTERFIERFRYKPTKAVQVQSRIKMLEKIERIEIDETDNSALRLRFPPAPHSGSYPLLIEDLKKRYGEHTVIANVSLTVNRGDKVAFVGKNGEGKTTLVKCIMNQTDFEGSLKLGYNVQTGYFAQNEASLLDENLTVFETVDNVATGDIRTRIRDILGAFMFGGEASDKKVKVLSGGERSRLAMLRLLLQPFNLLILDEPTNHLDMQSKEILKNAVREFDGTVIVVSHDRAFLDGLVDKIYEFGNGTVREYSGGIYDYLNSKNIASLDRLPQPKTGQQPAAESPKPEPAKSYEQQKEENRRKKQQERKLARTEELIASLETRKQALEQQLSDAGAVPDNSLYELYADICRQIDEQMQLWEQYMQE